MSLPLRALLALSVAAFPSIAAAQMDPVPDCEPGPSGSALREELAAGTVGALTDDGYGTYVHWATSTLAAGGKDPSRKLTRAQDEEQEEFEYRVSTAHAAWTCTYSAERLTDGNTKTTWAEGAPGSGVGEVVVAMLDTSRPVEIWAGLGVSPALHKANERPRRVRVYVLQSADGMAGQSGLTYQKLRVLAKHEVELRDHNGFQPLPLPTHKLAPPRGEGVPTRSFVALEILSVYPGAKYTDTCISEVRNAVGAGPKR